MNDPPEPLYVVTPEHTTGSQLLFRENTSPMIAGKHVLILAASVTTGYTAQAAVEAINYYGGQVVGIGAIFATQTECAGYPLLPSLTPTTLAITRAMIPATAVVQTGQTH